MEGCVQTSQYKEGFSWKTCGSGEDFDEHSENKGSDLRAREYMNRPEHGQSFWPRRLRPGTL